MLPTTLACGFNAPRVRKLVKPTIVHHLQNGGPQIDKEGANPERVKQELANNGVLPEEWGGDTPMVQVFRPALSEAADASSTWL